MFGISLREVDKTIVKPHLAGATLDTFASVVTRPVENVEALAGQETQRRRRLDDRPLSTM